MSDVKTFAGAIAIARANTRFSHLSDNELATKTVMLINGAIKADLLEVYFAEETGEIGLRPTEASTAQVQAVRGIMNTFRDAIQARREAAAAESAFQARLEAEAANYASELEVENDSIGG